MRVRLLVAIAVRVALGGAAAAHAEPRLEASGFIGVDWFGKHSALGNSWAPEQVPGTSVVFGARIGWLAPPALPGDLRLALEAELGFAPAFTGSSAGDGRMMYFAPVFEWRGQAVLRFTRWPDLVPHLVVGAGSDSVVSRSPFMADDTEPIVHWGAGLIAPMTDGWQLRVDVRQGVMPARNGGALLTAELAFGIGATLGEPGRPPGREPESPALAAAEPAAPVEPAPVAPPPAAAPPPPLDPDGDGITGDADLCPDQPEDKDGFQDADGCPDPDNDGDGIDDAHDACPDAPETVNGWQDDDGCPDEMPDEVAAALGATLRFAPNHARITEAAGATLRGWLAVLEPHPELRIAIIGHAERPGGEDLARRRAEAAKWYLVDLGVAEDRIAARVGPVPGAPAITFQLVPRGHP
ncbi:MAG TPA: OmpA family protein [Kofleriaceae bacterium]|nr:OmpA family protein [Kofleriaceae bacterium]